MIDYTNHLVMLYKIGKENGVEFDAIKVGRDFYKTHVNTFGSYSGFVSDKDYVSLLDARKLWALNETSSTLDNLIRNKFKDNSKEVKKRQLHWEQKIRKEVEK